LDYKAIRKMTAVQLREQLAKFPDVSGVSAMKKDALVELLSKKLGVSAHTHAEAQVNKTAVKQQIRALKKERDAAVLVHDKAKLAELRHRIHKQKHILRRAIKEADFAASRGKKA
jgi:hypothetical protein